MAPVQVFTAAIGQHCSCMPSDVDPLDCMPQSAPCSLVFIKPLSRPCAGLVELQKSWRTAFTSCVLWCPSFRPPGPVSAERPFDAALWHTVCALRAILSGCN